MFLSNLNFSKARLGNMMFKMLKKILTAVANLNCACDIDLEVLNYLREDEGSDV